MDVWKVLKGHIFVSQVEEGDFILNGEGKP